MSNRNWVVGVSVIFLMVFVLMGTSYVHVQTLQQRVDSAEAHLDSYEVRLEGVEGGASWTATEFRDLKTQFEILQTRLRGVGRNEYVLITYSDESRGLFISPDVEEKWHAVSSLGAKDVEPITMVLFSEDPEEKVLATVSFYPEPGDLIAVWPIPAEGEPVECAPELWGFRCLTLTGEDETGQIQYHVEHLVGEPFQQ